MGFDKIKEIIAAVAPTVATALGGPLAGAAVGALSNVLLGKKTASEQELLKAINNPEALIKLKQIENDFIVQMQKLDIDVYALEQADKASARQREVELAKAGSKDYTNSILAFFMFLQFTTLVFAIFYMPIQKEMMHVADILLGTSSAGFMLVLNYYFGSSYGSRQKDKIQTK